MKPHPRIRKTVKWGGLVGTFLLLAVWVGSTHWWFSWIWHQGSHVNSLRVELGELRLMHGSDRILGQMPTEVRLASCGIPFEFGWALEWHLGKAAGSTALIATVPVWMLALLPALCGIIAWSLDTLARGRARVGHCSGCGYDLLGLAEGMGCPECGAKKRNLSNECAEQWDGEKEKSRVLQIQNSTTKGG